MSFYADLHIHSKYSRATSRDCDLEHLAIGAQHKGISVVGTGDFTHPGWLDELRAKLVPAEPGLFRLRDDLEREVARHVPSACHLPTRFMLSVEISCIYKADERTRKVHNLVYVPSFDAAERVIVALSRIGNLAADGRPILGLDARHLLEIVLQSDPAAYLVPAHIWTPWFAVLGSKSGFDSIDACFRDLAPHVFALETGLSADPPMHRRLSQLDRFALVSNSDAHSPGKLGREACVFSCALDYYAMRQALRDGAGFNGTIEFFPEEGKYHHDGHRACNVCLTPEQTRAAGGLCPVCCKPLTMGVLYRVDELADRHAPAVDPHGKDFASLVPLPELLAESLGTQAGSKGVQQRLSNLIQRLGPELSILQHVSLTDIGRVSNSLIAEGIRRLRAGCVRREAGYDGVYGKIGVFEARELKRTTGSLFSNLPASVRTPSPQIAPARASTPAAPVTPAALPVLPPIAAGLNTAQAQAVAHGRGPLLLIAGPGTGKTHTLTARIAALIEDRDVPPHHILAITFTARAAAELAERVAHKLGAAGQAVHALTFHALGAMILREQAASVGLPADFKIFTESDCIELLRASFDLPVRKAQRYLQQISRCKRGRHIPPLGSELDQLFSTYARLLRSQGAVDFDDLIGQAVFLLDTHADLLTLYRARFRYLCIDEYQDIDDEQYRLVQLLAPADSNVCVIGDPDQSIYGFRGANVGFFLRFTQDYPNAVCIHLQQNYRSSQHILNAAHGVIHRAALAPGPPLTPSFVHPAKVLVYRAASARAEAEFIVHSIEKCVGGYSFFSVDSGRVDSGEGEHTLGDFAILTRTATQQDVVYEALERAGLPVQRRTEKRLLDDPYTARLVDAVSTAPGDTVADRLRNANRSLKANSNADVALPSHAPILAQDLLLPFAERAGADVQQFQASLLTAAQVDAWDARADRVSLLTLHAAKGLEFRVVFIAGCEDSLIPLHFAGGQVDDHNEERRIFYMGLTRAKERLILSYARRRSWRGKPRTNAPSPFLDDLPAATVERLEQAPTFALKRDRPREQLRLL